MTVIDLAQPAADLARAVSEIAKIYRTNGRWFEAVAILETALMVDELSSHDRARLQSMLATYLLKHADYDHVETLLSQAQANIKSVDDPALEAEILYSLGELAYFRTMLQDVATYAAAHQFHQKSLDIRERTNDDIGRITSWSRIGILHEREGDDEQARSYYDRSIVLSEKIGYLRGKERPLTHIGAFHHRNGDIAQALDYYEKAHVIGHDVGDADDKMFALMNVGYAMFRLNSDVDTVLPYLHQACEIAEKIGHRLAICVAHMRLGMVYAAADDIAQARQHYETMATVADENGFDSLREHATGEIAGLSQNVI